MRTRTFFSTFKREAAADRIGDVAAMMTYYALFALFPMMILVVTIALLVVPDATIQQGVGMMAAAVPGEVGGLLQEQVGRMQAAANAGFAVGGALLALWSASRGAVALSKALNDMYDKEETRPWWKRQLIAVGTTFLVAVILIVALGLLAAGPALGRLVAERFGLGGVFAVAWSIGKWLVAALLVMVVWSILYKWLPNTRAPFRIFTPGAVVGVALWIGVSQLFALYVSNFGKYEKTYGALGGVIIFLTWLWLSSYALLIGAEVNDVLADVRRGESPAARELAEEGPERRPPELRPRPT